MIAQCAFPPHSIAQSTRMSCPHFPPLWPPLRLSNEFVLGDVENESLWARRDKVKHQGMVGNKMSR